MLPGIAHRPEVLCRILLCDPFSFLASFFNVLAVHYKPSNLRVSPETPPRLPPCRAMFTAAVGERSG